MNLDYLDYLSIALYIITVLFIGIYLSKRSISNISDFFTANKNIPWWLSGISMVATTFAADTPLAVTGLVILHGISGNWLWWSFLLSGLFTTFFFSKLWYRANVTTYTELIELRYSGKAASFLRGFRAIYLAIPINCIILGWVTIAMFKLISITSGIDSPWLIVTILYGLTTIYIVVSGIRGVIVTDFLQFFIAMIGSFVVMYFAVDNVGGIKEMVKFHSSENSTTLNMLPSFKEGGTITLLAFCVYLAMQWWSTWYPGAEPGGGGYIAQRMFATKSDKDALKSSLLFNFFHYAVRPWPWIITALCILIIYPNVTNRAENDYIIENNKFNYVNKIEKQDIQNINNNSSLSFSYKNGEKGKKGDFIFDIEGSYAVFMKEKIPSGLRGLLIIAFISAFMSTVSTQFNWGSSYIVNDFYIRFLKKKESFKSKKAANKHYILVSRFSTIFIMLLAIIVSYFMDSISGAWKILLSLGAGTGLVYMLRWYWWRINAYSEISAMIGAIIGYFICSYYDVSADKTIIFTTFFTTLVWLLVTFLTPPEPKDVLINFYNKVQPLGNGWNAITNKSNGSLMPSILNIILSLFGIYGFLFGIGKVILTDYFWGICFILFALINLLLVIKRIDYSNEKL